MTGTTEKDQDQEGGTKRREAMRRHWLSTAKTLQEALPYILNYDKQNVVIKFGGNAMINDELATSFAHDMVLLKQIGVNPIVVHGGGPQIGKMLEQLNIETEFVDGLRVTDQATVNVVEMILAGSINKSIVTAINQAGGKAIGLSGKDGNLLIAEKTLSRSGKDIGFVGEPKKVNPDILETFKDSDVIPVIAPVGIGEHGETYNINADTAAGAIAAAVDAKRLLMLTDIAGVLNKEGQLITNVSASEAETMMDDGTISGGMIPKIQTCLNAVANGVEAAVIMDGRFPHTVILELFTEHGTGTLIAEQGTAIERE